MSTSTAAATIDLGDPDLYATGEPERAWAHLRRTAPVYWNRKADGEGFWALTRYADVVRVHRDVQSFTSERGMQLDMAPEAVRAAAGRMLIVTDPPRHRKLRQILTGAFTPAVARRLETNIRRTVRSSLDEGLSAGTCDLVELVSLLPVSVICDMLGVPERDWRFMLERTRTAFESDGGGSARERARAHADLMLYYAALAKERRRRPMDDLVSALAQGEVDGARLTDDEVVLNCHGLILGGNETTRHAAAGGVLALVEHPEEWARLRSGAAVAPAVEEVLRWTTPGMHVLRTAVRDVEIAGVPVRAGQRVTLWNASANRDEAMFEDPDRFDVGRAPNRHVAFGMGEHHCLGAALARLELGVLLEELVARVARVELTGPVARVRSNLIRGIARMPVRLHAA